MSTPGTQKGHASRLRMGTYGLTPDQNLVQFLIPSTSIWQPPRGLNAVRVVYTGGGAGGGSGRLDATGIAKGGGAGGGSSGSGDVVIWMAGRRDLFAPWMLTVGAGGVGGASVTGAATNGLAGTSGSQTTIALPKASSTLGLYQIQTSTSPTGGAGGTATTATAGAAGTGHIIGQVGGGGLTAGAAGQSPGTLNAFGALAGGGGGGVTLANVESIGGVGGIPQLVGTGMQTTAIPGGAAATRGNDGYPTPYFMGMGASGGGGSNTATSGGGGGDGIGGGGGGGGGAGLSVTGSSGRGGDGGHGFILLFLIW